ncbi:glycosyltransferase family 4 protein [Candidatus Woesearchaeota archaeon]|nr:glycosyltransferase family 4 protein [Candidatus Woesearchaeota archaeon]
MRILYILDNYWPFKGGAETLFKNLAEGTVKKGHTATVLTRKIKGTKKYEEHNGVKIHRINSCHRYLYSLEAIPKAIKLAEKADVIHTSTFNSAFPAWIAARAKKKPAVITIHEVWLGKWAEYTDMSPATAAIHDLLEQPIYRLGFKKHICVSESTRKQLLKCKWINPEKTMTIYNGLDYSHFDPKKHDGKKTRKKLGLGKSYTCLTFGRAAPSKGLKYAAKAIRHIRIKNFKFLFIIAKDHSKSHNEFIKEAKKAGNKAIIHEPVSYEELPDYIAAADCIVVPSLSEGFGYAAAEACAMGKPVVASNTTSLPEVVSGKYILAKPKSPESIAEAIHKAYNKEYTTSKPKRFTIEKNVEQHIKLYNSLVTKQ